MENKSTLVQRADKVAFYKPKTGEKYFRMKGFTGLSISKNPKEYTRQYVDELFENTDVVGISAAMDFAFDQYKNNKVHEDLAGIIDNEIIGTDATREIVIVDFTEGDDTLGFTARAREYSVIPNTEGGSLEAYTYEGTFRVKTANIKGLAKSEDDWETCTFEKAAVEAGE